MSDFWQTATLLGATTTTGLTAGLFYTFAHSVMPGLGGLDDHSYLRAFGRIDKAIENPWMGLAFVGSPILTTAALALHLHDGAAAVWLGVGLGLVLVATGITAVVNLPLNREVQAAAPGFDDAAELRRRFERRWVGANVARTVASVGSVVALAAALVTR